MFRTSARADAGLPGIDRCNAGELRAITCDAVRPTRTSRSTERLQYIDMPAWALARLLRQLNAGTRLKLCRPQRVAVRCLTPCRPGRVFDIVPTRTPPSPSSTPPCSRADSELPPTPVRHHVPSSMGTSGRVFGRQLI